MPAPQAPSAAPVFNWEKAQSQLKPPKKKSNPLLVIAVAAIVLLAVSGVWRALHAPKAGVWVKVVSAARDIPAGSKLGFTSVKYMDVPKMFATPDMVTSLSYSTGRVTRAFVPAGEPILADMLFTNRHGVSGTLETHERAITLQLADDSLVDHEIAPDDLVDVLVVSNKDGKKYTRTICQSARVLVAASKEQAVSHHTSASANKITLAVTPDLAEALTEAVETGKVRLVLRNRLSRTQSQLSGIGEDDLLPAGAFAKPKVLAVASTPHPAPNKAPLPPPVAPPASFLPPQLTAPVQWMVDVFSGSKKESYGVPAR